MVEGGFVEGWDVEESKGWGERAAFHAGGRGQWGRAKARWTVRTVTDATPQPPIFLTAPWGERDKVIQYILKWWKLKEVMCLSKVTQSLSDRNKSSGSFCLQAARNHWSFVGKVWKMVHGSSCVIKCVIFVICLRTAFFTSSCAGDSFGSWQKSVDSFAK